MYSGSLHHGLEFMTHFHDVGSNDNSLDHIFVATVVVSRVASCNDAISSNMRLFVFPDRAIGGCFMLIVSH